MQRKIWYFRILFFPNSNSIGRLFSVKKIQKKILSGITQMLKDWSALFKFCHLTFYSLQHGMAWHNALHNIWNVKKLNERFLNHPNPQTFYILLPATLVKCFWLCWTETKLPLKILLWNFCSPLPSTFPNHSEVHKEVTSMFEVLWNWNGSILCPVHPGVKDSTRYMWKAWRATPSTG